MPHTFFVDLHEPTAESADLNLQRGSKSLPHRTMRKHGELLLKVTRRFLRLSGVKFGAARGGVHTGQHAFAGSAKSRPLRPVPLTVKRPQFPLKKQNIYRLP